MRIIGAIQAMQVHNKVVYREAWVINNVLTSTLKNYGGICFRSYSPASNAQLTLDDLIALDWVASKPSAKGNDTIKGNVRRSTRSEFKKGEPAKEVLCRCGHPEEEHYPSFPFICFKMHLCKGYEPVEK